MDYDVAIIGAGPAGYSAGVYAARSGLTSVLFDRGGGGGRAGLSPRIENYAGFELIPGVELMEKMKQHASKYVVLHPFEEVREILSSEGSFSIRTVKQSYEVSALILCTWYGTQDIGDSRGEGVPRPWCKLLCHLRWVLLQRETGCSHGWWQHRDHGGVVLKTARMQGGDVDPSA